MNKAEDIFNYLQTQKVMENLFFNERPIEFEERNFAIFNCNSIKKTYSYSSNMQYKCNIKVYNDDFNSLMQIVEAVKNLFFNSSSKKLNDNCIVREMNFNSTTFSQTKYKSQSINLAEIEFSMVI